MDPTDSSKTLLKPTPYGDPAKKWSQVGTGVRFGCGIPLEGGPPICWDLGGSGGGTPAVTAAAAVTDPLAQLSVGSYHACGVTTVGKLICWGEGTYGALGNGKDDDKVTLGSPAGADWASVSAGDSFTCALKTDASLFCFGRNSHHEVSPSNDTAVLVPYQVPGTWKAVSTGESYTLAITSDGDGMGWGRSESVDYDFAEGGMLGAGTPLCFDPATEKFCDTSAGSEDEYSYSTGLETNEPEPVPIAGGIKWDSLSAGGGISCGVQAGTGAAYCWGYTTGEASVEGSPQTGAPKKLDDSVWSIVTVGQSNTRCGITQKTGSLWCWGRNSFNCEDACPLGDGTEANSAVPVRVLSEESWLPDGVPGSPGPGPSVQPTASPAPAPAPAPAPPPPEAVVPMSAPPPPVASPPPPVPLPPDGINGNAVPPAPSSAPARGAGALGVAAALAAAAAFL